MTNAEVIYAYLSLNGARKLAWTPKELRGYGYESSLVMAKYLYDLYEWQHSLALDAQRQGDACDEEIYENRANDYLYASRALKDTAEQSPIIGSALLPVVYEKDAELDFAKLMPNCAYVPEYDIILGQKVTIVPAATKRRGYLTGITRPGMVSLTRDKDYRRLWLQLLMWNSVKARPIKAAFGEERLCAMFNETFDKFR